MKQVLIYNQIDTNYHGASRYQNEELFNYFKAQIDWSLSLGWKKTDIIIGTNFDFSYNGITNYHLYDVCKYSGFNNFWYGAYELLSADINNDIFEGEDFWLHDQDSWPVRYFDFPIFEGEIAGCEYQGTNQWNCGSIYCKNSSKYVLEYIVKLMKDNPNLDISSDEVLIGWCRFDERSQISDLMKSINTRYNVGVTHFQKRFDFAEKPINVFSFKPDKNSDYKVVEKYLPKQIKNIFIKHNLGS